MSEQVKVDNEPGSDWDERKRVAAAIAEGEQKAPVVRGTTKAQAGFFAAVRQRGMLNAMLDGPAEAFEANNPGFKCRWEFSPKNGDKTMVTAREAVGFHLADASQLGEGTDSAQKSGAIQRGDLVLMYAPKELVDMIAAEDARAAHEDHKLPETTYREHVRGIKAKLSDGTVVGGEPVGNIRRTVESRDLVAEPSQSLDVEGGE